MIIFETYDGVRTKASTPHFALINWYYDQVIKSRNNDKQHDPVYIADDHETFVLQIISMIERQFNKSPKSNTSDVERVYKELLRFIRKHGDIKKLVFN